MGMILGDKDEIEESIKCEFYSKLKEYMNYLIVDIDNRKSYSYSVNFKINDLYEITLWNESIVEIKE